MTNGDAKTAHAHGNLKLRVNDDSYGVWPYCHQHVQWCAATVQHLQSQCHSSQNGPTRQLGHLVCECQSRAMFSLSQAISSLAHLDALCAFSMSPLDRLQWLHLTKAEHAYVYTSPLHSRGGADHRE